MFGRRKHWEDAVATVVSFSRGDHQLWKVGGTSWGKCDLVLDVYPQGSAPFRVPATQNFAMFLSPSPGDQLRVRFDPASHEVDVLIDGDPRYDPQAYRSASQQAAAEQRQRDLSAPPGTPPARPGGRSAGHDSTFGLDPELADLMRKLEQEHGDQSPS